MKLKVKDESFDPSPLAKELGMAESAIRVFHNRGLETAQQIRHFLYFKPFQLRNVEKMQDAGRFLMIVTDAIMTKKHITIYGDYDGDGVMATTIWWTGLYNLCRDSEAPIPHWFINNRFKEGYGMNVAGVQHLLHMYPETQVIITCDNGIKANEGVQYAIDHGITVVVSDHHGQSEGEALPNCPVVCEKRLDESPNGEWFCGAELSRRLVIELYRRMGALSRYRDFCNRLIAFSGLATITDSITMNAANHFVAKDGIRMMAKEEDICWQVFREECKPSAINEDTIGFRYGPMINADGRVTGSVDTAMDVFISSFGYETFKVSNPKMADKYLARCRKAVRDLVEINEERKGMSAKGDRKAMSIIKEHGWDAARCIVLDDESFEEGINGLISGHITEQYHVPSIVLCPKDGDDSIYKGSARSVPGFNIFEVLNQCKDLLIGFGGHPGAAGVSIKKENIPAFRERIESIAERYVPEPSVTYQVDFILNPDEISPRLAQELASMAPFGEGFAKPTMGFKGDVTEIKILKERHVMFSMKTDSNTPLKIFWWNSVTNYESQKETVPDVHRICGVGGMPTYKLNYGKLEAQIYATEVQLLP